MFRVEVRLSDPDRLVETVDAMQTWLTQHGVRPVTFGYSLTANRTLFRIEFAGEADASVFVEAFGGAIGPYSC